MTYGLDRASFNQGQNAQYDFSIIDEEQPTLWETDSPWLGQYMMQKTGVYPKEEREYRLSRILEDSPHPKYCLSARACQGIINRAEKRGKILPEILETASLVSS